ncbi:ABC transporter permease [Enterocloster sp. OA13]|uniref:ABC transporter permease n=1 Tax=Enterocloster hominis (ex Hitch et al. 2024) TaxID=1917870 RepID=A0ABV1D5N5_9FIRM|nr:ABC transporter permease [Lachnoclostridium pacaense]EEQ61959.1 branched-chain amino acid ABC transporter, permease protein [Clostridiales bacterium 1_7_47FAA]MCD8171018.1 ABC transporter permease [Clostridiales bacterium]MCH1949554.1 ABC transporter permease [Enterocloster sp. OA13]MCC2818278.1 ABC transporter permease [Lachnoclostridium pacaense]MCC2875454.1 ABC transporter permease [Lachnoclostridium pacaense]
MEKQPDNAQVKKSAVLHALLNKNELGTILPLCLLLIVVGCVNPNFFAMNNILDILKTSSFSFIVAVPITFLMASGGMDLSIGAATSFGGVVCAFALKAGMPIPVSIVLALGAGAVVGVINGIVIVYFDLPPFIATLGTQYAFNGIIAITTENLAISGFSSSFKMIGQNKLFGMVPLPVVYALIIGIIGHIILVKTKYGRAILAIGGNRETAYLAGINVRAKCLTVFIATSMLAALSGVLMASRFASAQPAAGTGTELTIMASVIIGGTSMFGGTGTVLGSALGCILLATITNALIVMKVSTFWQNLIFGVILLAAIFIDKYRRKAGGAE